MKRPFAPRWRLTSFISRLLLVLALVCGVSWLAGMLQVRRKPRFTGPPAGVLTIPPTVELARTRLLEYFSAPDDSSKCALLHDSGRVGPLWIDYHRRRGHPLPMLDEILSANLLEDQGRVLAFFELRLASGERQPLAMIWDGAGFGLDWESFTAYGTIDWIEWVETQPEAPQTMRVYLSRLPEGFSPDNAVEGLWVSVEHRDALQPVIARVEPGSGGGLDFTGRQRIPVTAEFEFKRGNRGSQLHLTRLIHEGWSR